MATVVVNNEASGNVTVGGFTFAPGANNIDSDVLLFLAQMGLLEHEPDLYYDLSAMEP